ncbi:dihydrolipoyl dehydrogenase [Rhodobacter sp. 24-YEA-8]|uniref:dihydrolipoyl dehydrogenase n=1 Tax=Rhodobacter sp. 24-YEA-8 TaxID=1884310 RepID=UPI000897748C|nr:dihydrolipoyl dehydrogenase [Rhodobacter sp. 24-YEA-8]SED64725.1 dihydrolipoamide dehydrogenase [Rhodobacter sp. 24-YEA-8]
MNEITCRLLIIGGGPGGYVCALRAAQLGIDTVLVEEAAAGGTCLNIGCIPSKALIHVAGEFHRIKSLSRRSFAGLSATGAAFDMGEALEWKDGVVRQLSQGVVTLLRKAKVRLVTGHAELRDGKTAVVTTPDGMLQIRAETLVIATGSAPAELAALPFGGAILSSAAALALTSLPASLAVVGGGYIGLELGMAFAKLGVQVTVAEAGPRLLPVWDRDLTAPLHAALDRLGVTVLTGARAGSHADGVLHLTDGSGPREVTAEKVLVTIGRRPRSREAGIPGLDLARDGDFIRVDADCRTSMAGVFAIGDVTGNPMLAHRAMAQGERVARLIAGERHPTDHRAMPAICFTDPEIVSVGLLPEEAAARGAVKIAIFPFAANGKALTEAQSDGFVRVIADPQGREILGIQATGAGVAELAGEFALAIEMGATLADIAATIHAHPSRGEAFHEAGLRALGQPLHL